MESPRTKSRRVIRATAQLLAKRLFALPDRNEQIGRCWLRMPLNRSVDETTSPIQALASIIHFVVTAPFDVQLRMNAQKMFLLLFGNRPQICVPIELLDVDEHKCITTLSMFAGLCFNSGCQVINELRQFQHNDVFETHVDRIALVRGVCAASLQTALAEDRFRLGQTWVEAALTQAMARLDGPAADRLNALCAEVRAQSIPEPSEALLPLEREANRRRANYVQSNGVQWRDAPIE